MEATLGWCYLTEELTDGAGAILASLRERMPHVAWVGGVGAGVLATGIEYIDEPALAVMLCNLPASDFRIFMADNRWQPCTRWPGEPVNRGARIPPWFTQMATPRICPN